MSKRGGRSLDDIALPPWCVVAFTDLHVSARTLERALRVLAAVREEAVARRAKVVFCGDFWDARGVLNVRQVDALLDEFQRWRAAGVEAVLIPGNHDQVSIDGRIHGIRLFEPFPNVHVVTEPLLWPERKIAFLPWREEPAEQSALFERLADQGGGWTIFAHAEVEGAMTNHAHVAVGRVSLATIGRAARACYVGHYHKRQQLGDRTWYLGSPFEMTFGEMGDPKGLAVITEDRLEPEWRELPGFPRHHRLTFGVLFNVSAIEPQDIVEVYVPPDRMGSEDLARFLETVPADDVRPLPLKVEGDEDAPPAFALTLDQAVNAYVDDCQAAAESAGHDLVAGMAPADLKKLGAAVLAELPDARAINPMSPRVEVLDVEATQFCALGGNVKLGLEKRGLLLLKGRVGAGKTALVDAVTWCLYGTTNPRKAGANGATFRGDEVIHDDAPACGVVVRLRLHDGREVRVEREKKRGKGATLRIDGVDVPDGIADTQDVINRIVGLDGDLWRTCVSLGQGAVGNFVTDADKRRKEVLATAFGLTACEPAQKLVRSRLKPLRMRVDKLQLEVAAESRALEELRKADLTAQIESWEQRREQAKEAARAVGETAKATIAECDRHLAGEATWLESRAKHEEAIDALTKQLTSLTVGSRGAELEREIGAAAAEKSVLERDLARVRREAAELQAKLDAGPVPCPTCGKPMEATHAEKHVAEKQHEAERIGRGIRTLDTKLTNLRVQRDAATRGTDEQRVALEAQLSESRHALAQIGQALSTFTRLRANREEAERKLAEARDAWQREDTADNPFIARQQQLNDQLSAIGTKVEEMRAEMMQLSVQAAALEFWDAGFGPKGLPVLVLRTAIYELEQHANRFLAQILGGSVIVQLAMTGDDLTIRFYEQKRGEMKERRYEQLSGGQRRCVELAFAPFALSEMIFARCGVRVPLLVIDELTTHLGQEEKPLVCELLRQLDRDTVLVIDHDAAVQGEFDVTYALTHTEGGAPKLERAK